MQFRVFRRRISSTLQRFLGEFRVVALTGPRQSGKTTLLRHLFPDRKYINLEDPEQRRFALEDPKQFLNQALSGSKTGITIDEVQRAPELFSYIQLAVDDNPTNGRFVLSGSQNFLLLNNVSQSLAGRVGILHLLPLSRTEMLDNNLPIESLENLLHRGGYPALAGNDLSAVSWLDSYIETYIERDVRQILRVNNLELFRRFVRLCAGRVGQLVNLSSLGNDCGISHSTAREWLSLLESSFIVQSVSPYHKNFGKRLIKSPKLYFQDTGVLCALLGIKTAADLVNHSLRGGIFESWVFSEVRKVFESRGTRAPLYFWRDQSGNEVDLLIEQGTKLLPIEIKSGATVNPDYFVGLNRFRAIASTPSMKGLVVYGGAGNQQRELDHVVSWGQFKTESLIDGAR